MEKETKELKQTETFAKIQEEEQPSKKNVFKANLAILLCVLLIFGAIMLVTGVLGTLFGKLVENIVLSIVAVILIILLVKSKRS